MSARPLVFVRRALCLAALALGIFAPAAYADARADAKSQVQFGIVAAQHGLWREALSRWQRAVEIDPSYAAAWNNLAIAHEQAGHAEQARAAFAKALAAEPKNAQIRMNYELFKEAHDRQTHRRHR